jgi:diguanylate cyclase (GGDEF)-like protein/PAS domain S-box-containing protein
MPVAYLPGMNEPQSSLDQTRYRDLFATARHGIFITDAAGIIIDANAAAGELTATEPDLLRGQPLDRLFCDLSGGAVLREQFAAAGALHELEARLQRSDSRERWCLISLAPHTDERGRTFGYHAMALDITQRRLLEERLLHDVFHDGLTGLPNRALFMDRLRQTLARCERLPTRKCAVLFLDLDRFKRINDSYGHATGDALLTAVATALVRCMRREDTIARIGGDEFAILLESPDGALDAPTAAERILHTLREPLSVDDRLFHASVSIGIAYPERADQAPSAILANADLAMYRAKAAGPARYEVFNSPSRTASWRRQTMVRAEQAAAPGW